MNWRIVSVATPIIVALALAGWPLLSAEANRYLELRTDRPAAERTDAKAPEPSARRVEDVGESTAKRDAPPPVHIPAHKTAEDVTKSATDAAPAGSAASLAVTVQVASGAPPFSFWVANSPNPFGSSTDFSWSCAVSCHVSLQIYDVLGRVVATLADEPMGAGIHHARWNGTDSQGRHLVSGVYLCRFVAGSFVSMRKVVISR